MIRCATSSRYVRDSTEPLYEEWFYCQDLGVQLKPVIGRYFKSEQHHDNVPKHDGSVGAICMFCSTCGGQASTEASAHAWTEAMRYCLDAQHHSQESISM
jgi:hypothetical protein